VTVFIKLVSKYKIQYYWNKRSSPYWMQRVSFFRISIHVKDEVLKKETGNNVNLFRVYYYGPRPSPEYSCWKRTTLYPIRTTSFVSI